MLKLKSISFRIWLVMSIVISIVIYSCSRSWVKSNFRNTYEDHNEIIHKDSLKLPFFKAHLKNGNAAVIENWSLNKNKDTIIGGGKLYDFNRNFINQGELKIPLDEIAIIETNELERIKAQDNDQMTGIAIMTGVNLILDVICITNPKACFGSCPTFYIDNDSNIHMAKAEGFSSSISPSLEKSDIDALSYQTSSTRLNLTMKNEAFETHMLNKINIYAIKKNKRNNVFIDNKGNYYECGPIMQSHIARNEIKSITNLLAYSDGNEYFSLTADKDLASKEELILEFYPPQKNELGLVINFRQTLLTTFLLYSGISYMGDQVGDYFAQIENNTRVREKLKNPFNKLGKIKIYQWDHFSNDWVFIDEQYETGPIAQNKLITPLNELSKDDKIKIKVEMTKGLWRIDQVGLTTINSVVHPVELLPNSVLKNGNVINREDLLYSDNNYLVSFPGDEFNLTFALPSVNSEEEYELFLNSQGYYLEWIRRAWLEGKNLKKLKGLLNNDRSVWAELAQEYKTVESEMESVFWNSKYSDIQ